MQRITCHLVRVNSYGYAYAGRQYFGVSGLALYYVELEDGRNGHVRAPSRELAIHEAKTRPAHWGIR